MRYLCAYCKLEEHYYPRSDLRLKAKVDEYLDWHSNKIRAYGRKLARLKFGIDKPSYADEEQETYLL